MFLRLIQFAIAGYFMVLMNVSAHQNGEADFMAQVPHKYRIVSNIAYSVSNKHDNKLDLYVPEDAAEPVPVVMYIHGGGWIEGSKEKDVLGLLQYLNMGWAVVNVEYRLAGAGLAPAAVEDCLCALRWIITNAVKYNLDKSRIVTTGTSAGGHLALMSAMAPHSVGLSDNCPSQERIQVAAVVNWYGITDVNDLLDGPNLRSYAIKWLGSREDQIAIAKRVSPITYVRSGLPPILTIHGDEDAIVPYQHAVILHEKLSNFGVPNKLHTVSGGRHGGFNNDQYVVISESIRNFLDRHALKLH